MPQIFENRILNGLVTPLIAGVVLSILAPFGSSNFPTIYRFIYWIGMTLAGGLGALLAAFIMQRYTPNISVIWQSLLQSIAATCAVAPFVMSLHATISIGSLLLTLFYIWVVAIVITTFGQLAGRRQIELKPELSRSLLLDRLPPKFRDATLYAISSEDHYVRIHSAAGEHMVLMRLSDAEDLALPLIGLKPHRSWWVAESGVESVSKSSGKLQITLKSGTQVPVSREGAKRVRDAGWI